MTHPVAEVCILLSLSWESASCMRRSISLTPLGEARSSIWSLLCRNSHPLNDFHFNEYHAKAGGIYL
jgi:hypothetical protein